MRYFSSDRKLVGQTSDAPSADLERQRLFLCTCYSTGLRRSYYAGCAAVRWKLSACRFGSVSDSRLSSSEQSAFPECRYAYRYIRAFIEEHCKTPFTLLPKKCGLSPWFFENLQFVHINSTLCIKVRIEFYSKYEWDTYNSANPDVDIWKAKFQYYPVRIVEWKTFLHYKTSCAMRIEK